MDPPKSNEASQLKREQKEVEHAYSKILTEGKQTLVRLKAYDKGSSSTFGVAKKAETKKGV